MLGKGNNGCDGCCHAYDNHKYHGSYANCHASKIVAVAQAHSSSNSAYFDALAQHKPWLTCLSPFKIWVQVSCGLGQTSLIYYLLV